MIYQFLIKNLQIEVEINKIKILIDFFSIDRPFSIILTSFHSKLRINW
jgi:hypothetical protein